MFFHVMQPTELMAEFGLTQENLNEFKSRYESICAGKPVMSKSQFMDYWLGDEKPVDKDNKEFGSRIWAAFDVDGNGKMDVSFTFFFSLSLSLLFFESCFVLWFFMFFCFVCLTV